MTREKNWLWYLPACGIAVGIFLLSTFLAAHIQLDRTSYLDKWEHAFAYFALSFSLLHALQKTNKISPRLIRLIIIGTVLYGLTLELMQLFFFANRYFEWIDALANTIGSLLGLFTFKAITRYGKRQ